MRPRNRLIVAGIGLAVAFGAVGAVWLTRPSAASQLTLGEVTTGSLSQSLDGAGTVAALGSVDVGFPTAATVTSVSVKLGDSLTAGQELATIDDTELRFALADAALTLGRAEEDLEAAENAADEDATATATSTSSATTAPTGGTPASTQPNATGTSTAQPSASGTASARPTASPTVTPSAGASAPAGPAGDTLEEITERLTQSRDALDEAWRSFGDELAVATGVCVASAAVPSPSPEPTVEPTVEPTPEATPEPTADPSPEPSAGLEVSPANHRVETGATTSGVNDCVAALEGLEENEKELAAAREAYDSAVDDLVVAAKAAGAGSQTGTTGDSGSQSGTSSQGSTGTQSSQTGTGTQSGSQSGTGQGDTATQGATQAGAAGGPGGGSTTVGQAEATLAEAQLAYTNASLALDRATLVAPADGILTALPFVEGQAAATGDLATVTTTDAVSVAIEVPVDDIGQVAVGQQATVTSDTGSVSRGSVGGIALLPTTSNGSATYPVTIVVDDREPSLIVGTTANVDVTVSSSDASTLVPISAVTLTGDRSGTVRVFADGTATTRAVELGVRGATHIEVTDGVSAGEQVVLSDASIAIPTSDQSTVTSRMEGGFSGAPGGGMPPGR